MNNQIINLPLAKRVFDILFSFTLIIILLPVILVILLAIAIEQLIRLQARPKLFYIEKRISAGKPFDFIKFNIFRPGVVEGYKKDGVFIHTKVLEHDGHSLSAVGKIIQKIYFDEVPQLFCVLKGDMSVVGPRPLNLEVFAREMKTGPSAKAVIKTGLTGPY